MHAIGDDQLDDHGLVDMQSHRGLEACVIAMEGTISSINVSLSQLNTLFNDFVNNFASNGTSGGPGGGPTHVVTPPTRTIVSTDHVGTPHTREGAMFKSIKPPFFKGEDKKRNKDEIVTFV